MAEDKMWEEVEVVIVGAGIPGLATALALKRVGAKRLVVLEKAPELRATGAALSLFPNAWRALAALGVVHKLNIEESIAVPQLARVTNFITGAKQEITLGKAGSSEEGVRTVHRRVLLETLAEELAPEAVRLSTKITSIDTQSPNDAASGVVLHLNDGTVIRAKVLIGCDGMHSMVAHWLGLSNPVDSGRGAVRGVSVFPDGHGLALEFHHLLGKNERAGFTPMNDKDIYWFVSHRSKPSDTEIGRDPELILKHVTESMAKDFPSWFLEVVRHADPSSLSWAPLMLRLPWDVVVGPTHKGNVTVAGDAFHPMTLDLGQGGCAALEDAVVLGRNMAACLHLDGSVDKERAVGCLANYVAERRWRAARLIVGAFLSGWMEQGGSGWWEWGVKFVRDSAFYRFLFPKMRASMMHYNCGNLPTAVTA